MTFTSRADLIRAIFTAYRANDRERVAAALSDDFRFTTPFDDGIDKETYFARCWKNAGWIERHDIERIFVEGEEAFVTYHCVSKDGKSFRNTEFFVFAGDKVRSIEVFFGAAYQHGVFAAQAR